MENTIKNKTVYLPIDWLKPHPNNPRTISDSQFSVLCDSIAHSPEYFEARPIITNKEYVILAGNMRHKASLFLGLKEVPVIVMDLTEEKQKEIMIRDNKQNGEWDWEVLTKEFEIPELIKFGFEDWEFASENMEFLSSEDLKNSEENKMYAKSEEEFLNTQIKQVVLFFDLKDYIKYQKLFQEIMKEKKLSDNTEVVKYLFSLYLKE